MKLTWMTTAIAVVGCVPALGWSQVCWDENPSLAARPRESHHVCTPRPRGGFGFWSWVTSVAGCDSYVMPKNASRGYTFTARFGLPNDFNSGPRLRHYVNYLPLLPYTHPPVYPTVPGGESAAPSIEQLGAPRVSRVQIEY